MLAQEQQQGELKQKLQEWIGRFVQLKMFLFAARADIEKLLGRSLTPQDRQEIGHLSRRQGELEQRFFEIEGRLIAMAQALGYSVPGLSNLGDNPVMLLASTAKLWWDATAHIQKVAAYKARIGAGQSITSPPGPGGKTAWGIGTYLLIGLGAWVLLKKVL